MASPAAVYAVTIRPGGLVEHHGEPWTLDNARAVIGTGIDVWTAPDREHVGAVDEWSAHNGSAPNFTAWCCYGGSMLYGTACVWRDDHGPLSPEFVAMVEAIAEVEHDDKFTIAMADTARDIARAYWSGQG